MTIHRPKRIGPDGPTDDLKSDDLLVLYTIEYDELSMENFGVAMVTLLTAMPDNRLWSKPLLYTDGNSGVIHAEGILRKTFEASNAG